MPQYPVYVISKGRADQCMTANFLVKDGVSFLLVVEPQEAEGYVSRYGVERVAVLPFTNLGLGSIPARNWVWDHALANGHEKHWIFDDNIRKIFRRTESIRIPCNAGKALDVIEHFSDRYDNLAITGMQAYMFAPNRTKLPPFYVNNHVYSNFLIRNDLPYRWRGRYNEDTDLCLQVLANGWCTVLLNVFLIEKMTTMTMKGGNTTELYHGDGRLKMARSLERLWPGVVETKRRFRRPQHVIKNAWTKFDTPLKLKPGIDLSVITPNEHGLQLVAVKPIKSDRLRERIKDRLAP